MARIQQDITIGQGDMPDENILKSDGTMQNLRSSNGRVLDFSGEVFQVDRGFTFTADRVTIICTSFNLQPQSGTTPGGQHVLTNCTIIETLAVNNGNTGFTRDEAGDAASGSAAWGSSTMTNCDWFLALRAGEAPFDGERAVVGSNSQVTLTWDDVRFWSEDGASSTTGFLNTAGINTSSVLSNVQLQQGFNINLKGGLSTVGFNFGNKTRLTGSNIFNYGWGKFLNNTINNLGGIEWALNPTMEFTGDIAGTNGNGIGFVVQPGVHNAVNPLLTTDHLFTKGQDVTAGDTGTVNIFRSWNPVIVDANGNDLVDAKLQYTGTKIMRPWYAAVDGTLATAVPAATTAIAPPPVNGFLIQTANVTRSDNNTLNIPETVVDGTDVANVFFYGFEPIASLAVEVTTAGADHQPTSTQDILMTADVQTTLTEAQAASDAFLVSTLDGIYDKVSYQAFDDGINRDVLVSKAGSTLDFGSRTVDLSSTVAEAVAYTAGDITVPALGSTGLTVGTNFDTVETTQGIVWRANSTITANLVAPTVGFAGGSDPAVLIDGGDVSSTITLIAGTYTIRNADVGNLTVNSTGGNVFLRLENTTGAITRGANVLLEITLNFTGVGGVVGSNTRFQIYPVPNETALPTVNGALAGHFGTDIDGITITTADGTLVEDQHYVYVYSRPGFNHIFGRVQTTADVEDIQLFPAQTAGASLTGLVDQGAVATILPQYAAAVSGTQPLPERIQFLISNARAGQFGGVEEPRPEEQATNNLFESAKGQASYANGIARLGLSNAQQLIAHTSTTQTSLLNGFYSIFTGNTGNQQNITSLQEMDVDANELPAGTFRTPTNNVMLTEGTLTVNSVIIAPQAAGISFGDFQAGNAVLQDNLETAISDGVGGVTLADNDNNSDRIVSAVQVSGAV